jgi:hypothetical protein
MIEDKNAKALENIAGTSVDKNIIEKSVNNFFKHSVEKSTEVKEIPGSIRQSHKLNTYDDKKRAFSKPRQAYRKTAPVHIGREDKVDADIFYRVKDENESLKRQQMNQNDQIKKLEAGLEKVKYGMLVERRLGDRKVIHVEGGFDIETETTKLENEKLKDQVKKMRTIIKGMQSEQGARKLGRKNLINAKQQLENQSDKNEYLAIINHLREQLKNANNDIKQLSAEVNGPHKGVKQMGEYHKDVIIQYNILYYR